MHGELDTVRGTLDELYPSLDDVPQRWDAVLADAGLGQRRERRRWPRVTARVAAVAALGAAIALGALSLVPGEGPSAVARAAAVLAPADGPIIHSVMLVSNTSPDGTSSSARIESWQLTSPPFDKRELLGRRGRELAEANGAIQFYDARTDTIYTSPPNVIPLRKPRGLAAGGSYVADLLASGEAREGGRVTVGGREAIRIFVPGDVRCCDDGTLLVDASTYEPIEWRTTSLEGIQESTRVLVYELLLATPENKSLVNLTAQHPGAQVVQGGASVDEGTGGSKP